jgi:hypothetical protein
MKYLFILLIVSAILKAESLQYFEVGTQTTANPVTDHEATMFTLSDFNPDYISMQVCSVQVLIETSSSPYVNLIMVFDGPDEPNPWGTPLAGAAYWISPGGTKTVEINCEVSDTFWVVHRINNADSQGIGYTESQNGHSYCYYSSAWYEQSFDYHITVIGYVATNLERHSWGSIKTSFSF